jgi:predicted nucleic acid-binding protein
MDRGLDTTFLVQAEVVGHPGHAEARVTLDRFLTAGDRLVLAPQVLAELVHVVTDSRRFSSPLGVASAAARAEVWWSAEEVRQVSPDDSAVRLFLSWMTRYRLGRKRVLDTLLAATYHAAGVGSIVSTNARDFAVFGCFELVVPGAGPRHAGE